MRRQQKKRTRIPTEIRSIVKSRDSYSCQRCFMGIGNNGHIHHKNCLPTDNRPDNLIYLCSDCHIMTHAEIGYNPILTAEERIEHDKNKSAARKAKIDKLRSRSEAYRETARIKSDMNRMVNWSARCAEEENRIKLESKAIKVGRVLHVPNDSNDILCTGPVVNPHPGLVTMCNQRGLVIE